MKHFLFIHCWIVILITSAIADDELFLNKRSQMKDSSESIHYWISLANTRVQTADMLIFGNGPSNSKTSIEAINSDTGDKIHIKGGYKQEALNEAIGYLDSALIRYPNRADILIGRTQISGLMESCTEQVKQFGLLIKEFKKHKATLVLTNRRPVKDIKSLYVSEIMNAANIHFNEERDDCVRKLADQLLNNFPNSIEGLNVIGAILTIAKNDSAVTYLEKAYSLAPNDQLILSNLIQYHLGKNNCGKAKKLSLALKKYQGYDDAILKINNCKN